MARIRGRSSGRGVHTQMMDAVMSEAQHWVDVAQYAASEGRTDVESMALQRLAQLARVADLSAVGVSL